MPRQELGIPEVNFDEYFKTLVDRLMIRLSLPPNDVKLIDLKYNNPELHEIIKENIPTPAIFIRVEGIRPQHYVENGATLTKRQNNRMYSELKLKAWIVVDANLKNEGRSNMNMAVAFAAAVNTESRFSQPIGPAQVTEMEPVTYLNAEGKDVIDCFNSYSIWRVSWFHECLVGDLTTLGFCDELQIDPADIKEVYISFDSQRGKIESSVMERTINGRKHRIYRGVNPDNPDETFESDYVLIASIEDSE